MKKVILSFVIALYAFSLFAAIPSGYYNRAEGLSERALKTALFNIIKGHTDVGYDGLYNIYPTSDDLNGQVWDMYSTCTWTHGKKKCGSYKNICDCYNREHMIPQSWFNKKSPMRSDAFHIYPTDGKVNGLRSNYPIAETNGGPVGGKGLGRLGSCSVSGYSGRVYEPDDQYKGDVARTYFYFVTRYESQIASFNQTVFANNTYPSMKQWYVDLMLKWHRQDPVSQKERDRNDAVYAFQHNRNPFIDHPELAEHIWGNKKNTSWSSTSAGGDTVTAVDNVEVVDVMLVRVPEGDGFFIVANSDSEIHYEVYSVSGMRVDDGCVRSGDMVQASDYKNGVYIVRTRVGRQENVLKLVVQHR